MALVNLLLLTSESVWCLQHIAAFSDTLCEPYLTIYYALKWPNDLVVVSLLCVIVTPDKSIITNRQVSVTGVWQNTVDTVHFVRITSVNCIFLAINIVLPDTDVLLQEQDIVELCLLHPGPVREVHHVRAVEDDQAQ